MTTLILPRSLRNSYIYLIQRKQDFQVNGVWYFHELGDVISQDTHPILWTALMQRAHKFDNEKDVEEFKQDFMYDRNTEIVRIKRS